ncbi:MAG: dihydroxyacetone kinase phosphoryl donor subunit DhaM [Chloroflexaceae bacterium]|jgi:phosphocarrier protein FPr|nr:dihydroxyacetone kinase phosphoryl donor subunit DhaM [Chloroflexaceae bacterium]
MVSLLIISHSAAVARGVKELADQMVQGKVPIAAAGGTLEGELGTSADVITAALDTLPANDGVLVLVDMGSAIMSAEIALEMSGRQFIISRAPIVEGAIVGAIQASAGASLEQTVAAAERALEAKQVGGAAPPAPAPAAPPPVQQAEAASAANEIILTINNQHGLHARPAKDFVQTAARFKSTLRVKNLDRDNTPSGNAKSMIDIMRIGVSKGQRISITADGPDAAEALAALEQLAANNFGEG